MPFRIRGKLSGCKEAEAALAGLKESAARRLVRPGVAKAARMVARVVKAATPVGPTGQLRRSEGSKVFVSRRGTVVGLVGPRTGFAVTDAFGRKHDPALIAHVVERGRKAVGAAPGKALLIRGRKGGAAFRRGAKAAPGLRFLSTAWDQTRAEAAEAVWSEVLARVRARAA